MRPAVPAVAVRGRRRWIGRCQLWLGCGDRGRRAGVLDRDDDHAVVFLDEDVDQNQPSPGAEDEPVAVPSAGQGGSKLRELNERTQRPPDAKFGVARQAVRPDQCFEILGGGDGKFDASHALQLIERDRLARCGLLAAELSASERAGDAVQQFGNVPGVRIGVIERDRQKRSSNRARLDVHPVRESGQLLRLLGVKGDVQTLHEEHRTRCVTDRVAMR